MMKLHRKHKSGLAAALTLAVSIASQAAGAQLPVEAVGSFQGKPYDVKVINGSTVVGKVRKGASNPARRLTGTVQVELLDHTGQVLETYHVSPRRMTLARHSYQARFSLQVNEWPDDAAGLRVGYQ